MHTKSNLHILYAILVVMVAQAYGDQLMCYICDDCPQITEDTPTKVCDETFFNQDTTLPTTISTSPTTEKPTTMTESSSTTSITTTIETTETTLPEETQSTSPAIPTPPTVGPVETTTALPTPPNTGTVAGLIDADLAKFNETTTTTTSGSTFSTETIDTQETTTGTTLLEPVSIVVDPVEVHLRGRRAVSYPQFTYHCYSVQQIINGTSITSRGCSRITPTESLCSQLEQANNNTKFSTCTPCSNTLCNSSTALGTSMIAITMGLLAALLFRSNA